MTAKMTQPLEDRLCPKCGQIGQLKKRLRGSRAYYYIDHYQSRFHLKYVGCCYLGTEKP